MLWRLFTDGVIHPALKSRHSVSCQSSDKSDSVRHLPSDSLHQSQLWQALEVSRSWLHTNICMKTGTFAVWQEVAAVTMPSEQSAAGGDGGPVGRFLQLGKLEGRLVCSPDLDQLLSCASDSIVHPICGQPAEWPGLRCNLHRVCTRFNIWAHCLDHPTDQLQQSLLMPVSSHRLKFS